MVDKITHDTQIYSDIQSLKQLHLLNSKDSKAASKEVAQQFEALLMQMVLKSMRDANKAFSSGTFDSNQMNMYQDMLDKQMSLVLSSRSIGIAQYVEKSMAMGSPQAATPENHRVDSVTRSHTPSLIPTQVATVNEAHEPGLFESAEKFVQHLWQGAKKAAAVLKTDPKILLAQAALETNWGQNIISHANGSSYNLFNIKAGNNWQQGAVLKETLEEKDGVIKKEKAAFKNYQSYQESFADFVNLLKNNSRYQTALDQAADAPQFIKALQQAGYATDHRYAEKVMQIFNSKKFKNIMNNLGFE